TGCRCWSTRTARAGRSGAATSASRVEGWGQHEMKPMDAAPYVVGVVLDTAFGVRLTKLAATMPVWIVDTPINRAAAEDVWRYHRGQPHTEGVTTFAVDSNQEPEEWLLGVLETVDLHHGIHSHTPPYSAIEVIGVHLTHQLRAAFED